MATRYEIGESLTGQFDGKTTVTIVMTWPYGEPTPPILHSDHYSEHVLCLNSKKYSIIGFEYEPAHEEGENHTVTYQAHPVREDHGLYPVPD